MSASTKLVIGVAVVVAATLYMAYVGGAASWKYYLTTDECLAEPAKFTGQRLRVSGTIAPDSLHIAARRTQAQFTLRGQEGSLQVRCSGLLPDNLAEEMHVVVEGTLDEKGVLLGQNVLTRCASKYAAEDEPSGDANPAVPDDEEEVP